MGIHAKKDEMCRNGLKLEVPSRKGETKLRSHSFQVLGPRMYNDLPMELRNRSVSMEIFKSMFDKFLEVVPDYPRIGEGSLSHNNTLEHQLRQWNWSLLS